MLYILTLTYIFKVTKFLEIIFNNLYIFFKITKYL